MSEVDEEVRAVVVLTSAVSWSRMKLAPLDFADDIAVRQGEEVVQELEDVAPADLAQVRRGSCRSPSARARTGSLLRPSQRSSRRAPASRPSRPGSPSTTASTIASLGRLVQVTRTVSASALRSRARCAESFELGRRLWTHVLHGERVPCFEDVARHGETHVAGADEPDEPDVQIVRPAQAFAAGRDGQLLWYHVEPSFT